jgi:hypothetical protein
VIGEGGRGTIEHNIITGTWLYFFNRIFINSNL